MKIQVDKQARQLLNNIIDAGLRKGAFGLNDVMPLGIVLGSIEELEPELGEPKPLLDVEE